MRRFVLALTVACLSAFPALAQPEVKIAQGTLSGAMEGTISEFKDIPFAAPPVGPLRWRAPQTAPSWKGVHDASAFGPICPQAKRPLLARAMGPHLPESEDCLTLNVWAPAGAGNAKLPVMVWIYGGSFIFGGSASPIYDGIELAQHSVVVVTLNYRLGWLGFFDHPALATENPNEPTGNFGLLDQVAALKWVQANIARFGGDPSNVTIFGESAGGMSINDMIASPLSRGLFAKAISESGLGLNNVPTADQAHTAAIDFATAEGAPGNSVDALAKLRALSVAEIIDEQSKLLTPGQSEPQAGRTAPPRPEPMIDGRVLTDQPSILFARGNVAHVPYIAGSNSDEATLMKAINMSNDDMFRPMGDQMPVIRKVYEMDGKLTDDQFAQQVFSDALFASAAQGLAGFENKMGEPAYVYRFAYVADPERVFTSGVGHGREIPFVFGLTGLAKDPEFTLAVKLATAKDKGIAAMMESYWTNFAKTGNPNGPGLPQWPTTSFSPSQTLVVDDQTKAVTDFRKAQIAISYAAWSMRTGLPAPQ